MSEPRTDYKNPFDGARSEMISASSALNMEPHPIENPPDEAHYLSDLDHWAHHAQEHIYAALENLSEGHTRLYEMQRLLFDLAKNKQVSDDAFRQLHDELLKLI